jgi:outer membrane protein assembly factor BamD (BamD/ComL family)
MKIKDTFLLITLLFMVFLLSVSCSSSPSAEEQKNRIEHLEQQLKDRAEVAESADDAQMLGVARKLAEAQRTYGVSFTQDTLSPEYLFKSAMIYSEMLNEPQEAISLLNTLQRRYPDHDRAEKSLFLVGFTYAEKAKDFKRARLAYLKFLEKYPDSELVPSVRFELQYLDQENPEEAMKSQLDSLLQQ